MKTDRSALRVRDRLGETIVEVIRDGVVVAEIYGTREGIQVVSNRFNVENNRNRPLFFQAEACSPSVLLPLLATGEPCAWCRGTRVMHGERCLLCLTETK